MKDYMASLFPCSYAPTWSSIDKYVLIHNLSNVSEWRKYHPSVSQL